uniref:Uncharacterized protein n=1 Tax=viral metagenome TaxID=1070528 RepID=A0A6C0BU07_9ZZZZ
MEDTEDKLTQIKNTFIKIIEWKMENEKKISLLDTKIMKLKGMYNEFIKNNKETLCVFGLDSLYFQGKIIDIEYDDVKRLFSAIINRMYCEFFKLYKIVVDYIKTNIKDKKLLELVNIHNQFPVYKDLEPFKIYDFDVVQSIHDVIVELLYALHNYFTIKERELEKYKVKNKIGFNIDNFVNTVYFNNIMLREKITLFINYLEFFHRLNIKYLSRYYYKLEMMLNQINNDIHFEEKNDENATYEMIDVREMKEKQVIHNDKNDLKNTTHLEKFFETPHDNKNEIPSDLISELSVETIVTETQSKSNSNNLKKKKYKARKKNKQQEIATTVSSSIYNSEFMLSEEDKNIKVVIEEAPVVVVEEAPVDVVEEAPVVVVEEAPVDVVEETPVDVVEETPVVVIDENTNNA